MHNDPDFAGKEVSLVGISQGGLIARTVVETCENLNVHTLFTFGSPHQGVSVYSRCHTWWCPLANYVLGYLAELTIVQDFCAPADYFRTWWNIPRYYEQSIFLPDINNEKEIKDPGHVARLENLKNFGLWMWLQDNIVAPKESEWFAYWDDNRDTIYLK